MRVFAILAYDGAYFEGFQQQKHTPNTVMGRLIEGLKTLHIHTRPSGSGRTDRGVHGLGQVVHIDLPSFWSDLKKLQERLNEHLHPHAHIKRIFEVPSFAHARFSAASRTYRYIVDTGPYSPFLHPYRLFYSTPPPLYKLQEAFSLFQGVHDFNHFKKSGSPTSHTIRYIQQATVYKWRGHIVFRVQGNGFLRSQVRLMVAAALAYGEGKITLAALRAQLANQACTFRTPVPPNGLYLARISYEKTFLPATKVAFTLPKKTSPS